MRDETKKLNIEGLENRVAPFTIYTEPTGDDPVGTGGDPIADPGVSGGSVVPDQPGNSDPNRKKLWHENQ
jgi:hypothetical protein